MGNTPGMTYSGQFAAAGGPPTPISTETGTTVASYDNYLAAQRAVDHLSDKGFPVENVSIIGTNLRMIELVTGRMTTWKAAAAGAGTGAWFGLLLGLLFSLFVERGVLAMVAIAVVIGAVWGAIFGFVAHWMTRGKRDFSSVSSIQAGRYDIVVANDQAEQARTTLSGLGLPSQ